MRSLLTLIAIGLCLAGLVLGCGGQPGQREFKEGVKELEHANYPRARVLLEESITKRPASEANALAYNYLGVASTRLDQRNQAIEEFEESHRLDPFLFAPAYNLAVLYSEGGDQERAKELLEAASVADPTDTRALEYLGHLYLDRGEWSEARRVLYRALDRKPNSPAIVTAIALVERELEGVDRAVAYLMRALEMQPDYPPALYDLATAYHHELNNTEKAVTFYQRYLELAPQSVFRDSAVAAYEQLVAAGAVPAGGKEEKTAPLVVPEEVVSEAETQPQPPTFDELLRQAEQAAQRGESEAALRACLRAAEIGQQRRDNKARERALRLAVSVGSEHAEAHFAWGLYCLERARYEPALQAFKRACVLNPRWVEAHVGLAEAAVETAEYDAALVTLKQAARLDPKHAEVRWALASLYDQHLGVVDQAILQYREFCRRFPGDARVVRAKERLDTLEERQRKEQAELRRAEEARLAKEKKPKPLPEPKPPEARPEPVPRQPVEEERRLQVKKPLVSNTRAAVQAYNRGTIYQERKDWDRAIYYYTRAIENDSSFANAYYNLGTVYKAAGDLALAKDAYLNAVQLQPRLANARYNLALVYMELNQTSAAVEQLRSVLRLESDHAPSHYVLGFLYSRNPQAADLARKHYETFLKLAPNDPASASVRTWLRAH